LILTIGGPVLEHQPPIRETHMEHWTPRMKAATVIDINEGKLTVDQACEQYDLSSAEIGEWQRAMARHGLHGLRVTRLHCYHPEASAARVLEKPLAASPVEIAAPSATVANPVIVRAGGLVRHLAGFLEWITPGQAAVKIDGERTAEWRNAPREKKHGMPC
jgi:hypothetical protein